MVNEYKMNLKTKRWLNSKNGSKKKMKHFITLNCNICIFEKDYFKTTHFVLLNSTNTKCIDFFDYIASNNFPGNGLTPQVPY
jgi:hypothetical protein